MATEKKIITMQEASEHNTKDDCWIVIDGKVYDVSSYLYEHPGGDDVILDVTGKDATDDFEDVGHSDMAREELKTFYIGDLDPATAPAIPELKFITKTNTDDKSKKLKDLAMQYWAIPVAAIGISVIFGFLHLRRKAD